ncbi:MAG: hypothetical protein ACYS0E_10980 [Planctomycetota bacterium]|jgi:hypothetical protein
MARSLTLAHLGALLALLALFLPVVGGPLVAALQKEATALPSGFSVWDLARLQGVGSISWHALLILSVGAIAALMAFTGPHRGLWIPAGAWLIGIAAELRYLVRELERLNEGAEGTIFAAGLVPWGWAAAASGALLMIVAGVSMPRA